MNKNCVFIICFMGWLLGCRQELSFVKVENTKDGVVTCFNLPDQSFPEELMKLSELGDQWRVVSLETTEESLVDGSARYFIGDSCIVVFQDANILLFDREGRFCRAIAVNGKGPQEFQNIGGFTVDEKRGLIFIIERHRAGIVKSFHLQDAGYFRLIPLAQKQVYHCTVACLDEDRLLLLPFPYSQSRYLCYTQNFAGQLLDSVPWHFSQNGISYGVTIAYALGDSFRYISGQRDTVAEVTPEGLKPVWIFEDTDQKTYDVQGETKGYLYFTQDIVVKREVTESGEMVECNRRTFWYDKIKQVLKCVQGIKDDFLSHSDCQRNLFFQQGEKLFVVYQAMELKKYLEAETGEKWQKLRETLSEEDNPVLLMGNAR